MNYLKKTLPALDKTLIKRVCIDDFAIRKRYTYGTVMIDIETHRIIDMIPSREKIDVSHWLRSYPGIEIVSRDGSQTYAAAVREALPNAQHVSDKFHIIKNFSEAIGKYINRCYLSKVAIENSAEKIDENIQALYDTRNRAQRIRYAREKRKQGYTIQEIAGLLHSSKTSIKKYLDMDEQDIPEDNATSIEKEYQKTFQKNKRKLIM